MDTIRWILNVGIPYYFMMGLGVSVMLILSEIWAQYVRGPEYQLYLQNQALNKDQDYVKTCIKMLCIWPIMLMFFVQAILKKRSWAEHIFETMKEQEEKKEKLKKELIELNKKQEQELTRILAKIPENIKLSMGATGLPYQLDYHWIVLQPDVRYPNIKEDSKMCLVSGTYHATDVVDYESHTHAIIPNENQFVVFRTDGPEGGVIDKYGQDRHFLNETDNFKSALKMCEHDIKWLRLCGPDHKDDRIKFVKSLKKS